MNNVEYVRLSLELHLFFDRIMKEHSFFLEAAFTEKDSDLKKVAQTFKEMFSSILMEVTTLANNNISNSLLISNELVTKNTLEAEIKTSNLVGSHIDVNVTKHELKLNSGNGTVSQDLIDTISIINKKTLPLIEKLIDFKNDILNRVLNCKMYTANYPLLITHIMNEAKMYCKLLEAIENREVFSKEELYEQEVFWTNIMKEHAEFIRGLFDPSEEELISTADKYVKEYKNILNNKSDNLTKSSLATTMEFRDFKLAGETGILNCKIKSIILPLLADHVLREANHFIRILENIYI